MKVITIGRSSQNNVIINDPKVSRHHCQIVQYDDGSYGIVDFGSTNGTYVNGRRVQSEERMNPNDVVRIGYTTLPWRSYFGIVVPPPKKTNVLPIILGVVGGVLAMAAMIAFVYFLFIPRDVPYICSTDAPALVNFTVDGENYSVEAIPGEIVIVFDDDVSYYKAKRIIRKCGGKIIAQIPEIQYYVASVDFGEEDAFIRQVRDQVDNLYISPNIVSTFCMARPMVIDNFRHVDSDYNATHGQMVQYSFKKGSGSNTSIDTFNASIKNSEYIGVYSVCSHLHTILKEMSKDNSPIINLSMGPGLAFHDRYWDDAPVLTKKLYRFQSFLEIYELLWIVRKYDDRDFVIIKSLGNEGVKDYEKEILQPLLDNLSGSEKDILDRHFLLVAAKDDYYTTYSNEMAPGTYNSLITTADISDMRFNRRRMHGTSFSSPRVAGYISKIMNDYDISAVEALQYAKQATKQDPNHLLSYKDYDNIVKQEVKQVQKHNPNENGVTSSKYENEYHINGCLKYRLVKDNSTDVERLELRNTCDEDIRVTGYLLNKVALHGGDNTLDFDEIVTANRPKYIDGFVENKCTITSVEKISKMPTGSDRTIGYVDLGLPSGTLWKEKNESGFYDFDAAHSNFGNELPSKEQLQELKDECVWLWNGSGYKVIGPNKKFIVMPAEGCRLCSGDVSGVGLYGYYWSFQPYNSSTVWYLGFNTSGVYVGNIGRCGGESVRLVQEK